MNEDFLTVILAAIAFYCFGSWLLTAWRFRNLPFDFEVNTAQFQLGICGITAFGFAGVIAAL